MTHFMQQLVDGMNAQWQMERANSQLTLGEIRGALADYEKETVIHGIGSEAFSYRGYYCDLAFKPGQTTVEELTAAADDAIGKEFTGYKGGEFTMGKSTPVWVADYGGIGEKITGFKLIDGELHVETSPDED